MEYFLTNLFIDIFQLCRIIMKKSLVYGVLPAI